MVSTRRQVKDDDGRVEEEAMEQPNENDEAPEAASSSTKKRKARKNLQKELKETLRSKNLGLIRISQDGNQQQQARKVVFQDTDDESEGDDPENDHPIVPKEEEEDKDQDDEDDAVEQMDSKAARDMAMAEMERESRASQATKNKKKKRKAKKKTEESDEEDDDLLQEDFFAELDAQKSALKKAKRAKPDAAIPKHTIFQTSEEQAAPVTPIEVNPGMELVVLGEEENRPLSLALTEEPSLSALYHSRVIQDGSDVISAKQKQKQTKSGRKPPQANWKRSQKMNRLLLGKGRAAPNFVVKAAAKTYKF